MKLKRRLISFVTLSLIIGLSWMVFNRVNKQPIVYGNFGTNIPQIYPILGIDVSHYQEKIDWQYVSHMKVGNDSIQFVYLKATEGIDFVDDRFDRNQKAVKLEELHFGAYHFYDPAGNAKDQGLHFHQVIVESDYTLLPVLDVETSGDLKPSELVDSILIFLTEVERLSGNRPLVYTYENFFQENLQSTKLSDDYFWIANYNGDCESMKEENVLVWQFSESGTVDGIEHAVDLNIAKETFWEVAEIKKE